MHFGLDNDIGSGSLPPLFGGELQEVNSDDQIDIVLPQLQREIDSTRTLSISKPLSHYTIAKAENNSKRVDESELKRDFHNTLDKACREVHHQNFEELSEQSLKNALEFQGRVYQDFTKEKAKLFEKKLVSTNIYRYLCIVTNCAFKHINRINVQRHLFKHIKVSNHYCEQCLPRKIFIRDGADLNKHKRRVHVLDTAIPKRGIKRIRQPVQNTMNGSGGFTVNQVSDSCLPKVRVKHRPIEG